MLTLKTEFKKSFIKLTEETEEVNGDSSALNSILHELNDGVILAELDDKTSKSEPLSDMRDIAEETERSSWLIVIP
jgi:hypothetical protein